MPLIEVSRPPLFSAYLSLVLTDGALPFLQVIANDRLGRKGMSYHDIFSIQGHNSHYSQVRVKCSPEDTVGDLKKLIAAQTGTDASKIVLKKWYANKLSTLPDIRRLSAHSR